MNLETDLVLVTGAAGWLGRATLDALVHGLAEAPRVGGPQAGLRIRALVLPGEEAVVRELAPTAEVVSGDVREPADVARFCRDARGATMLHLAGVIHPARVRDFHDVNVRGTHNVLSAAIAAGVRRAVVMSSNSPLGCNPHPDHVFDEESPYRPYMGYGRSKMAMEQVVAELRANAGMETVVIRAPWFYGPFQPPRQTLFFAMIRDGRAPIVGGGENLRSMAYTDNLVQGILLAAMAPNAPGRTYWIADRRPYSMNEIVDTVERLLESEFGRPCAHGRLRLPGIASEIALLADRVLQAAGLYHQKIHVLSEMNKTIACTVARAERELGYAPTIALEEGMRRSLRWMDERGMLPA
jgi:nucleoside-diphosphate-sugar epimerase